MKRARVALVGVMLATAVVAGLLAMVAVPQGAAAAFPGEGGEIFFESEEDGDGEIYSADGDGTARTNLTNSPGTDDTQPAVSADGKKVAFMREDPRTCQTGIHLMNVDGTGQTQLTSGCFANRYDSSPSWSPDGGKIVFVDNTVGGSGYWGSEISTINADGTGRKILETSGSGPVFSPDGTKIAYEKDHGLYVMNADGSEQTKLTPGGPWSPPYRSDPAWSPDGERIAFGVQGGIGMINADGTGETMVSDHGFRPAWSPDGKRIVFRADPGHPADSGSEIWTMNADGTGQTRLTTAGRYAAPDWGVAPGTAAPVAPPPTTVISSGPAEGVTVPNGSATFEFSSDGEGSSFRCKLDDGPLTACLSPERLTGLDGGKHTFKVMATDKAGRTDFTPASRTWTVELPNRSPAARDDAFSTRKNRIVTVRRPGVLQNDRDPDDDKLKARVVSRPKHGRLRFDQTGSFVYRPEQGYKGYDRFVYKVSDGRGGTDTARASIKVRAN